MEKQGIDALLKAEDEAAAIVQKAREKRVIRLRQAQEEAEKTIRDLREANKQALEKEFAQKDQGDAGFASQLKSQVDEETRKIESGYAAHHDEVVSLLLRQVTTVELTVGEALKQSLLNKAQTGAV